MIEMENEINSEHQFTVSGKKITIYPSTNPNKPVIYLNTFEEEGERVYQALHMTSCLDFTLVAISGLVWNHDMVPWDIPPISKHDTPCTGGAKEYLWLLKDEIIPKAEKSLHGNVLWRGLVGYSLAGLFAVYSIYQTELFSRIASISGSLWFPGFKEYVFSNQIKGSPTYLYFSLGDREWKTKNPYLKTVQENTEEIKAFYMKKGIPTIFQLNQGNHFKDAVQRTASGIAWILSREPI